MADEAQQRNESNSTDGGRFDQTRLYEPVDELSRQEEDIALAAELLQSGIANEREISGAVSDWSIHGSVSLAQHLERRGLLTAEQISIIKQGAVGRVERARRSGYRPIARRRGSDWVDGFRSISG